MNLIQSVIYWKMIMLLINRYLVALLWGIR